MKDSVSKKLDEAIENELNGMLAAYENDVVISLASVDRLERLYDLRNESKKIEEQKFNRYFVAGTAIISTVLPLACYGVWFKKGLKFEELGTFTSTTFRNLLSKIKPTSK